MIITKELEAIVIMYCNICGDAACILTKKAKEAYLEINKFRKIHDPCSVIKNN